ncbi:hypothetical protein [Anabaena azotica]|uniref:Uncharacterized protein n=1 Tax=Anabaena azotica FACHB-119 TaxID=947527 RepID=A0ABR8D9U0_9NOST|nr:hypothetical protein [Anabaena azotica]MBD2503970.1 hypothetical protein [Anabaena azotica FACHB-119]
MLLTSQGNMDLPNIQRKARILCFKNGQFLSEGAIHEYETARANIRYLNSQELNRVNGINFKLMEVFNE